MEGVRDVWISFDLASDGVYHAQSIDGFTYYVETLDRFYREGGLRAMASPHVHYDGQPGSSPSGLLSYHTHGKMD